MLAHSETTAQAIRLPDGRIAGHVQGDTFRKNVRGSAHMLRAPRGWASDVDALKAAQRLGATHIEVTDEENGAVYRASIAEMLRRGVTFDRGFGRQVVLPMARWERPDKAEQLALFAAPPEAPRRWWEY